MYETRYENPGGKLWVRPKEMFFENVTRDGKTFPRFSKVEPRVSLLTEVGKPEIDVIWPLLVKNFAGLERHQVEDRLLGRKPVLLVVAFIDEKLAGFKLGYGEDKRTFYSWLGAIDEEFRRLGLGGDLMTAQHEWCKARGFWKVRTNSKNKWRDMLILNLKAGFQIIGTYTDSKGEPKIILEKIL